MVVASSVRSCQEAAVKNLCRFYPRSPRIIISPSTDPRPWVSHVAHRVVMRYTYPTRHALLSTESLRISRMTIKRVPSEIVRSIVHSGVAHFVPLYRESRGKGRPLRLQRSLFPDVGNGWNRCQHPDSRRFLHMDKRARTDICLPMACTRGLRNYFPGAAQLSVRGCRLMSGPGSALAKWAHGTLHQSVEGWMPLPGAIGQ